MRQNLFTTISILLACFLTQSTHLSWAQRPTYPIKPPHAERGYEEFYTFKYGESFPQDPWVWGYTKEFAERFRMPAQWIEPELKGVLAVAFRMNPVGHSMCGLGGNPNNCWPHLECQMDIYYDNSIKLPWTREDLMKDFFFDGVSSQEYLDPVGQNKLWREKYRNMGGTGVGFGLSINDKHTRAFSKVTYYNRELFSGIGLIGVQGESVCPYEVGPAVGIIAERIIVGEAAKEKLKKAYKHEVRLPTAFIERAHTVYIRDNKSNQDKVNSLIEQFKNTRK